MQIAHHAERFSVALAFKYSFERYQVNINLKVEDPMKREVFGVAKKFQGSKARSPRAGNQFGIHHESAPGRIISKCKLFLHFDLLPFKLASLPEP